MADYRSNSYTGGGQTQIEPYYGFKSYSVSSSYNYGARPVSPPMKLKKGKSTNGSTTKSWGSLNDAEFQRKRRVVGYKVYSLEGRVKGSFRKSVRWLKDRYTQVVYGWW